MLLHIISTEWILISYEPYNHEVHEVGINFLFVNLYSKNKCVCYSKLSAFDALIQTYCLTHWGKVLQSQMGKKNVFVQKKLNVTQLKMIEDNLSSLPVLNLKQIQLYGNILQTCQLWKTKICILTSKYLYFAPKICIFRTKISECILNIYSPLHVFFTVSECRKGCRIWQVHVRWLMSGIKVLHNKKNSINLAFSGNENVNISLPPSLVSVT